MITLKVKLLLPFVRCTTAALPGHSRLVLAPRIQHSYLYSNMHRGILLLSLFLVLTEKFSHSVSIAARFSSIHSTKVDSSPTLSINSSQLPWKKSIQPTRSLVYMPMLEAHLNMIKSLNFKPTTVEKRFTYQSSNLKPARISSMAYSNSLFRNVRLTYFDAGDSVQVFNALWSPHYQYDIPMLGIDLISLGKGRVLSVIDFQPLEVGKEYSDKYIEHLTSIREKYPELQGTLSGKFYDDTSFFSKNMLFGRFTDESKLMPVVAPAMTEYLKEYISLAQSAAANESPEAMRRVEQRQREYDVYSAAKDPAVGLFDAYFGKEWSSDFVHEFLFPLSVKADKTYAEPVHNFKIPSS